jgi:alkanesulfonate monooxygenase SsuD/methylene tetrahydromethanopterin reductase-like flavin-dependent oxidoreductase (luciferase family)
VNLQPPTNALTDDFINTWCLYGSPDTVAAQVQQYADAGAGNILCSFTNGLLTPERWRLAHQSMELFATEVMPRFKAATKG